jgi:hypothetical protein
MLNQPDTAPLYGYMAIYLHNVHGLLLLFLLPIAVPLSDICTQTIGRTKDLKEAVTAERQFSRLNHLR